VTENDGSQPTLPSPEEFWADYKDAGLELPKIPAAFKNSLSVWDLWHIGTQPLPQAIDDYLMASVETLRVPTPDQFSISHSGHGVNSYSLNLRLAIGPLALLCQGAWGGALMDSNLATLHWNETMRGVSEVLTTLQARGRVGYHQRKFLITYSDFRMDGILLEVFEDGLWLKQMETENWQELKDELEGLLN
jgi:hypothetical protein